jgi:glycerol-3-phosphate acyltransferase PlsY
VATAIGVLLMFSPVLGAAAIAVWIVTVALTRYSSLGALVAALASPIFAWWLLHDVAMVIATGMMAVVLIVRHKANITNLLAGTEGRIGAKKIS